VGRESLLYTISPFQQADEGEEGQKRERKKSIKTPFESERGGRRVFRLPKKIPAEERREGEAENNL